MKSIFIIAMVLVLSALFFLIYWNQVTRPGAPEAPLLPGIGTFRGPATSPPAYAVPASTSTENFSPPVFIGPSVRPKIIGPPGPPPAR